MKAKYGHIIYRMETIVEDEYQDGDKSYYNVNTIASNTGKIKTGRRYHRVTNPENMTVYIPAKSTLLIVTYPDKATFDESTGNDAVEKLIAQMEDL